MALRKFVFLNATEGFSEEQAPTDELSIGKLTLVGVAGVAIDGGATRAVNFADPSAVGDLATKRYVDSVATGLDVKTSCRLATAAALPACTPTGTGVGKTLTANANGALSVDGIAVVAADRILVKDQASQPDNGIYVVTQAGSGGTPFILTRATDFDGGGEVTAGAFTFVTEGSANADSGWVVTTDDAITVDTTNIVFGQFSSTASVVYAQGLVKTGTNITVELDTAAAAQTAGAGGGSSGLEFDVNNASGKLRAAVHATGGIQRTGTGLGVLLDPANTLSSSASGLTVLESPKVEFTYTADEALVAGDAVACSNVTADRVMKGRADSDVKSRIIGIARTAAAGAGNSSEIVVSGVAASVLSSATAGNPYYLQPTGGIATTFPTAGCRIIQVGIAKNTTDLWVRIVDYGKRAA